MQSVPQRPQSISHEAHVSVPLQAPSPQTGGHAPQSSEQFVQVSVPAGARLQVPSPHRAVMHIAPVQSAAQDAQVSVPLQVPSPQRAMQGIQSAGQELHVSVLLHVPSPHRGAVIQGPQSV